MVRVVNDPPTEPRSVSTRDLDKGETFYLYYCHGRTSRHTPNVFHSDRFSDLHEILRQYKVSTPWTSGLSWTRTGSQRFTVSYHLSPEGPVSRVFCTPTFRPVEEELGPSTYPDRT